MRPATAFLLLLATCAKEDPPAPTPTEEPPVERVTPRVIYYTLGES